MPARRDHTQAGNGLVGNQRPGFGRIVGENEANRGIGPVKNTNPTDESITSGLHSGVAGVMARQYGKAFTIRRGPLRSQVDAIGGSWQLESV
jgi:hypothetical protein